MKETHTLLPKRVVKYIHEVGVRAMDHLADRTPERPRTPEASEDTTAPNAVETLVGYWKSMNAADKQEFIDRVSGSVVEVVAASATLPLGLKDAAKATRKVVKREARKLRKAAKSVLAAVKPKGKGAGKGKKKEEKGTRNRSKAEARSRSRTTTKRPAAKRRTKTKAPEEKPS